MAASSGQNRQAKRALNTGSKAWRIQRLRVLTRDLFKCSVCGMFGDQVDHIHNNAHEHVSDDELQTLCRQHHSEKTAIEQSGKTYQPRGCDINGNPRAWQRLSLTASKPN